MNRIEMKKPPTMTEKLLKAPKETQERITSLISEGKSLEAITLPSQRTSAELFTFLKVDDSLSKISASKIPFTEVTLNINPSSSKNFGKVVSDINKDLLNSSKFIIYQYPEDTNPFLDLLVKSNKEKSIS